MKVFSLIVTTYAFALTGVLGICYVGDLFLGDDAKFVVMGPALLLAAFSRRIVQKVMGYTLEQAYRDNIQKPE